MQFQRKEHKPAEDEAAHGGDCELPGELGTEVGDGAKEAVIKLSIVQGPLKNNHWDVGAGCEAWEDGDEEQHAAVPKSAQLIIAH